MKLLLKVLLALGILGGLTLAFLAYKIDPIVEKLRPRILASLSEKLGQEVQIEKIQSSLFPPVSIELLGLSLSEEKSEAATKIKRLAISADLFSLLKGTLLVNDLEIDGLSAVIRRSFTGDISVGALVVKTAKTQLENSYSIQLASAVETIETESTKAKSKSSIALDVRSGKISNSTIRFIDEAITPIGEIVLSDIDASISGVGKKSVESFELEARSFSDSKSIFIRGNLEGLPEASSGLPKGSLQITLSELNSAELAALAEKYSGKPLPLSVQGPLSANIKVASDSQKIDFALDPLNLTKTELTVPGSFHKEKGTQAEYTLKGNPSALGTFKSTESQLKIAGQNIQIPILASAIRSKVGVEAQTLDLENLSSLVPLLRSYGTSGKLNSNISITSLASKGLESASGKLDFDKVQVAIPSLAGLPIEVRSGSIALNKQSAQSKDLRISVAGQEIDAEIKTNSFSTPSIQTHLKNKQFLFSALNKYIALPKALQSSELENSEIDVDFNSAAETAELSFTTAGGILGGTNLGKTKLSASLSGAGKPTLNLNAFKLSSAVFGGEIAATGSLSKKIQTTINAKSILIEDILKTTGNNRLKANGTIETLQANLRADKDSLKNTLSGLSSGNAINGEITGFNVLNAVLEKVESVAGVGGGIVELIPEKFRPFITADSTQFDSLSYSAKMNSGDIRLEQFSLKNAAYEIRGNGDFALNGRLSVSTMLRISKELSEALILKKPKIRLLANREGILEFPVKIIKEKKTIVIPDISKISKNAIRATAQQAVERNIDKLDKIQPGLGDAINSLFK